jgi:hypothetical protein
MVAAIEHDGDVGSLVSDGSVQSFSHIRQRVTVEWSA